LKIVHLYSKLKELIVELADKSFRPYLTKEEIANSIREVAQAINLDYAGKNPILVAVLNGSFMFCSDLSKLLTCQPEIHFVKLSSYEGVSTTGTVQQLIGLTQDISNRHVIIIEDIVDTGLTIGVLREKLAQQNIASLKVATFLYKPNAYKGTVEPEYVGKIIPNDFVVGYGLDYNGLGRELPELYVLNN
jgi:hypoxanthine phosphoribosyltransferase